MTKILTLTTITAKQMLTADASARAAACNGGGCGCDPCVDPSNAACGAASCGDGD